MAALKLRSPDDVRRLFSALGEDLTHEALSVADVDQYALMQQQTLDDLDQKGVGISLLVAAVTAWSAVEAYSQKGSLAWGIGAGMLGSLFPIPVSLLLLVLGRRGAY